MAPHSSTLAWKIPWREEPGRLQSMGSLRVGDNSVTSLSLFIFMHWKRKWQPTPVFLPGESQGWGSLVGCCLWCRTELDMTEVTVTLFYPTPKLLRFLLLYPLCPFPCQLLLIHFLNQFSCLSRSCQFPVLLPLSGPSLFISVVLLLKAPLLGAV